MTNLLNLISLWALPVIIIGILTFGICGNRSVFCRCYISVSDRTCAIFCIPCRFVRFPFRRSYLGTLIAIPTNEKMVYHKCTAWGRIIFTVRSSFYMATICTCWGDLVCNCTGRGIAYFIFMATIGATRYFLALFTTAHPRWTHRYIIPRAQIRRGITTRTARLIWTIIYYSCTVTGLTRRTVHTPTIVTFGAILVS